MTSSPAAWTLWRAALLAGATVLMAGCADITRLHVEDDSSANASLRMVRRLGAGPGGPGVELEVTNTRAKGEQRLDPFETATLGANSIVGPAVLQHTVRVQSVQLAYNHLLFAGRPVEMEWFAGATWVRLSWDSASNNLADPRLSRRSTWYGPGGGVLGRIRLAPVLALELRYAGAVDLSSHGDSGARSSTELALAFKPAPALTLRAGLAETRTDQTPELLSTELSVRARGPFFNLGLEF